jgi:hypothetical protein
VAPWSVYQRPISFDFPASVHTAAVAHSCVDCLSMCLCLVLLPCRMKPWRMPPPANLLPRLLLRPLNQLQGQYNGLSNLLSLQDEAMEDALTASPLQRSLRPLHQLQQQCERSFYSFLSCRMRPWRMHLPASPLPRSSRPLHHLQQQPPQTPPCQMPLRTLLLQMQPPRPTK